ncbi:hypothetical protein [Saccharomonospora xinjiangensis]|uniref:hypothetical protein n=1 Tax=Saccharomonospora xinjiangensis TaxID=75294 RepID=UPI001070331B|nr:hypothetical protein [Saccharomonospora xinjiangensis]
MREKRAGRAAAIAAGLLAAAASAGCGGAGPEQDAPVTETRATTVRPFTGEGEPAPGLRITQSVSASCLPSALSPENELARRCFTKETSVAMDPCFVPERPVVERDPDNEAAKAFGMTTVALCVSGPGSFDVTKVYVLEDLGAGARVATQADPHWGLELADGTRCVKAFGVPETRNGQPLSYGCDDGGFLYGFPDSAREVWTIQRRAGGSDELTLTDVRTAWR